jgi:hypothetical protein
MGRIEIFRLELTDNTSDARMTLAGGRELGGEHYIGFDEFILQLIPQEASAFAMGVLRLTLRKRQPKPKPGPAWRRQCGDGIGPAFRVGLGLTDEGRVYVEVAATRVVCDDARGDVLLAVLSNLRADILAVNAMPEGADDMTWGIAAGLRGDPDLALPRWADDSKW